MARHPEHHHAFVSGFITSTWSLLKPECFTGFGEDVKNWSHFIECWLHSIELYLLGCPELDSYTAISACWKGAALQSHFHHLVTVRGPTAGLASLEMRLGKAYSVPPDT